MSKELKSEWALNIHSHREDDLRGTIITYFKTYKEALTKVRELNKKYSFGLELHGCGDIVNDSPNLEIIEEGKEPYLYFSTDLRRNVELEP